MFKELLHINEIHLSFEGKSKEQVLIDLIEKLGLETHVKENIREAILERESQISTGIGNGIALPHTRSASIDETKFICARLKNSVEFDSPDKKPVKLIFMLITKETQAIFSLKVLSTLARILNLRGTVDKLLNAKTTNEFYEVIVTAERKILGQI